MIRRAEKRFSGRTAYRGAVDPGAGAPGGVVQAGGLDKARARSSSVVAASTQARMDSSGLHRTSRRVSPL
jgi:hypothetical protein